MGEATQVFPGGRKARREHYQRLCGGSGPSGLGMKLRPTAVVSNGATVSHLPCAQAGGLGPSSREGTAPTRASRNSLSRFTQVTSSAPLGGREGGGHGRRKAGVEGSRHWRQLGRLRNALT